MRSPSRSTPATARALTRAWADTLVLVAEPAVARAGLEAHLTIAVHQLLAGGAGSGAGAVGADLVSAGLGTPETLGASIEVLGLHLPDLIEGDPAHPGTVATLAELAVGFSRALHDETRSVKRAQVEAERVVQESEHRLQHAALHDALTGLPNRAHFADRLATLFAQARPDERVGLCFLDIDGFKMVNDQFGHQLGDLVLIALADRLARLARETGYLVARFGGDEFAILVPASRCADDVVKVADRALTVLAPPVEVDGHTVHTHVSVGVVERPIADGDPTDLVRAADMTLHWAKSDPDRDRQLYDGERSAREVARYVLLGDLPTALDRQEIVPFFQPLVRLADGQVAGFEALARWQHPALGVLGPDRFIALAEQNGLIVPLGARLLRDACRTAAGWGADAPYISVNVAVRQIRHGALVETVTGILDDTGLPPHRLQLEITESDSVDQDHRNHSSLQQLAELGVRLAIDDFGSGYSNLGYLQAMPLDQLKIDARFLTGRPVGDGGRTLLPTLVDLAHTLGMTALTEGVETREQAEYLLTIGCDLGQGWYFGHPVPAGSLIF